MSAADHPTWLRIRNFFLAPATAASFVVRIAVPMTVMYFTHSQILLIATLFGPILIIGLLDVYFRTRFSLRSLLLAIVTLQIPIAILVTQRSPVWIGIGVVLLVFWLWIVGNKLERMIVKESSEAGRWKKIEPD